MTVGEKAVRMSVKDAPTAFPLTPAQVKRRLWREGRTLKAWAAENGYAYSTVSAVMSGKIKVARSYGVGYDIALKLGLVVETPSGEVLRVAVPR